MEKGWKREGNYIEVGRKYEVRREETRRKQRRHNTIQMEAGRKTGLAVVSGKLGGVGVGGGQTEASVREKLLCSSKARLSLHITSALWKRRGDMVRVGVRETQSGKKRMVCTMASFSSTSSPRIFSAARPQHLSANREKDYHGCEGFLWI